MTINDINQRILSHELQLGEKLNECVHTDRRSDFTLMLAMLAEDVREHSQFLLPQIDTPIKDQSELTLRKSLHLADKARLALNEIGEINEYNQASLIKHQQIHELKLSDALKPLPLAFRDDVKHIPTKVLTNTSIHCQKKLLNQDVDKSSRLSFDAKGWLDGVQTAIVKSSLLSFA